VETLVTLFYFKKTLGTHRLIALIVRPHDGLLQPISELMNTAIGISHFKIINRSGEAGLRALQISHFFNLQIINQYVRNRLLPLGVVPVFVPPSQFESFSPGWEKRSILRTLSDIFLFFQFS